MKRGALMAGVVLIAALWFINRPDPQHRPSIASFTVQRGTLVDVLREVGELASQDPVLLQAPFSGELKWLVQDGSWVEQGERVFVLDEEALELQVSTLRAQVVDKQQELRLTRLQADHARIAELQRVDNARNDLRVAGIRHRILITPPKGGNRLLELDAEVKPREEKLARLQAELEPLEERFRVSRAAYQEALQAWQGGRSRLLEVQMNTDLSEAKAGPVPVDAEDGEASAKPADDPREALMQEVEALQLALDAAREARDRDRAPYENAVSAIDQVDAEAQELYIQIEIEKRGLPATQLAIDRDIARLRLAESKRLAESGKRALDAGAMSRARYEQLVADAEAAEGRLEILEYRLEIASRPATRDEVAASEAALATAQRAVDNAQAIFDREMNILASQIAVLEAELAEAEGELERNGKGFPGAIEGDIAILQAELEVLDPDEALRREEIGKRLRQLEVELGAAKASPPHIVLAPTNGLVRLRVQRDHGSSRMTDIGDRWEKDHTVAMLYPPGNMRVQVGINEVNYQRVREGMRCRVNIPALGMVIEDAEVAHRSRIGRDREQRSGRWTVANPSGIIEFSLSVDLRREVPEFRQGMTVLLDVETEQRENVLYLPAAAVEQDGEQFTVLVDAKSGRRVPVEGAFFGDDNFVISSGLNEGDRIFRRYPGVGE